MVNCQLWNHRHWLTMEWLNLTGCLVIFVIHWIHPPWNYCTVIWCNMSRQTVKPEQIIDWKVPVVGRVALGQSPYRSQVKSPERSQVLRRVKLRTSGFVVEVCHFWCTNSYQTLKEHVKVVLGDVVGAMVNMTLTILFAFQRMGFFGLNCGVIAIKMIGSRRF